MGRLVQICVLMVACMCWSSVAGAFAFRLGDEGSEVAEIQGQLASLGYPLDVDGAYGPATDLAVKEFQKSYGLEADGMVDAETYTALLGREMPEVSRGSNYISRRVIQTSMQYLGVPYVWGGSSPSGFDCSGYTRYVFAHAGIYLPYTADGQYEMGTAISKSELIPGDLVFFTTYTYGASHVGIYIGDGNFIHAASSIGVSIASLSDPHYWGSRYIGARRII